MATDPRLLDKAGDLLVAAELMRRGLWIAYPASGAGFDMLAYRLNATPGVSACVPIRVEADNGSGHRFERAWFQRVPGLVLVHVWHVATAPEFYLVESLVRVAEALGGDQAGLTSWHDAGTVNVTVAADPARHRMQDHRDRWERVVAQFGTAAG